MGIKEDLQTIIDKETAITAPNAKMARFSYEQSAYDNDIAAGTVSFDPNQAQNIPLGTSPSYLDVNSTVVDKGVRSDATVIPRNTLNHFFGRASYNLNKIHDWFKSFLTTLKGCIGEANGVASLDENGRIPYSQLPESAMEYMGLWNADTNTPQLADGASANVNGQFYIVSAEGTQDLGHGSMTFFENDRVICTGSGTSSQWDRLKGGGLPVKGSDVKPIYIDSDHQVQESKKYAGGTNVSLNGTSQSEGDISVYAPTSAGAASKIPYMTSADAWSWVNAPTAANKVLASGSSSPYAPVWSDAIAPDGTIICKGSWGLSSQAPSASPAKGDMWIYAGLTNSTWMTGLTTGSCVYYDGSAWHKLSSLEIQLNGSYKASPSFYAPTSAGTQGYTLISNGSGAPSWSSRQYSSTSIFQDSYPSSASSSLFYFTNSSNARVSGITSFVAWKTVIYNYNGTEIQKIFHIRANTNGTDFAKLHLPSGEFGTFSRMGCVLMTGDDGNAHVDYVDNLQWGNSSTTYLVFYNRSQNKYKNYIIWGI